jgi:hypothetical protein
MQFAGSASWRFEEGSSQSLHLALYVREIAALPVPPAGDIPPLLASPPPCDPPVVPAADRAAAAAQWAAWWRRIVAREARPRPRDGSGEDPAGHEHLDLDIFSPPEFASLDGSPALRALAVLVYADANRWHFGPGPGQRPEPAEGGRFPWELVSAVADEVAAGQGVRAGDIQGTVQVLNVDGIWSRLTGPGSALCSAPLCADPARARELLRDIFISGIGPGTVPAPA